MPPPPVVPRPADGENSFKLYSLPIPSPGKVLGILGCNGIGKSTALGILAGRIKPNLGQLGPEPPTWGELIRHYRGSQLQNYFKKLAGQELRIAEKVQIDKLRMNRKKSNSSATVRDVLEKADGRGVADRLIEALGLTNLVDRNVRDLSGGELQRLAIARTAAMEAEVYIFDEPW